ncbi:MAG: DNA repair protein RecN [Deltaproteobacteria bacterium]|nr:DNA repair protein RecN [Deltaproteobacteria bacterium]
MLVELKVRDLVLIEQLDLTLAPGFNVLTGETGAGKSLVAAAMDLLLGRRAASELVRRGAVEAEVEGLFDVSDEAAVRARLIDAGLPDSRELLVRRVVPSDGRHRCYLNGRLSSLGVLGSLAEGLANVSSQHEHHALLDPSSQLALLDGFGGLSERTRRMGELHAGVEAARQRLERLRAEDRDRAKRLDYLAFQLKEIDDVAPQPDELERLEREVGLLRHKEQLLETARRSADELYEADGSIYERLGALAHAVQEATRIDPSLAEDARELSEATTLVEDAARRLAAYERGISGEPDRLEGLEERRDVLRRLMRKHGTDLAGVIAARAALAAEMDALVRHEEAVAETEAEVARSEAEAGEWARALTRDRRKAARKLSPAVTRELTDLSFVGATFEVSLEPEASGLGPTGEDQAEFLTALNPGEGAHPLRKVASGGELSRLMLAIKRALAGVGPVGTYIFDEVDAGIGGAVASAVGRKLKDVSRHHQVVCITHLPQIAALADAHFRVSKDSRGGRTVTVVTRLERNERVEELARMLGGERITKKTHEAAEELLGEGAQEER